MQWKKGYMKLSVFVLVLVAALYVVFVYRSEIGSALCQSDGSPCSQPTNRCECKDFVDDPSCGGTCTTGYECRARGYCCDGFPRESGWERTYYKCMQTGCNYDGACQAVETQSNCPQDCGCPPGQYWDGSKCSQLNVCPNGVCETTGSPVENAQNCPRDCDPCYNKVCNTPPPNYCSGNTRVTYNSPGTCSGGSCSYSTSSTACPTAGCASSDTRFTGGCSGGSCYQNNVYCGSDYLGCQDANTVAWVDNLCDNRPGEYDCDKSYSQQYNCDNLNAWYNTGGSYACCSGSTATTCQNQEYRDYGCSAGSCSTYTVTQTRTTTSGGTDCAASSGWYNTGSPYAACSAGSACTAQNQEYRNYGCSSSSCTYTVTGTQTLYSGCSACPLTGCSGDTRLYAGGCSAGSCTFGSSQDCNVNNYCSNSGAPYQTCSGSAVVSRQDRVYNDYTCSGGSCSVGSSLPSGSCPPVDTTVETCTVRDTCVSSSVSRHYSGTCSGGACSFSDTTCQFGCNSATGQCLSEPCSPNPCNSPPSPICSGNDRITYSSPGICTASGSSYSCSYPPSSTTCPSQQCSGETRQYGGTCSAGSCIFASTQDCNSQNSCVNSGTAYRACNNGQACDAQNKVYNDYTCSGGSCTLASSSLSASCPTTYSNCQACTTPEDACQSSSVLRDYISSSCSSGSCVDNFTDVTCQFGCRVQAGNDVCYTDPCSPNPCTTPPENICANSNTLNVYSSPGTCALGNCSYSAVQQSCTYGCLGIPGNDQCAANTPPTLSSLTLAARFQGYAAAGQTVTAQSAGSDPNNEQVRLRCGSASGAFDLCNSTLAGASPSCSFVSSFADSVDHSIYCLLEDSAGARSSALAATLFADNSAPIISMSRSPAGQITPGTSVTIAATASDSRSGVAAINLTVNSAVTRCMSTACNYTYTAAYGSHTYSASAADNVGNSAASAVVSFTANDAPTVQPISYTGSCRTGQTITLKCDAADNNQQPSTLTAKVWAGTCNENNCFATRSWTYFSGAGMDSAGGTFTKPLTITSPDGTGIAATCQATDELAAASNWGDAYPLCVVGQCQNPPAITVNSIAPNPSSTGTVMIRFTADRALQVDPLISVKPGSQAGGTSEYPATLISKQGNSYTFEFAVRPEHLNGIADISIGGNYTESNRRCSFSQIRQMTIDTQPPTTSIRCNNLACTSGVYRAPVGITLSCSDATTSCVATRFGVNGPPLQSYAGAFTLTDSGNYIINYQSMDAVGNNESARSQTVRVYSPQCMNPAEVPPCTPADEEIVMRVAFDRSVALSGETLNSRIYCFLRDKSTKQKTRQCALDPYTLRVLIDKGTPQQKDYFSYYMSGSDNPNNIPTSYDYQRVQQYLTEKMNSTSGSVMFDGYTYTTDSWTLPLWTNIFQSELCVNGTDSGSGLNGESCGNYTVSDTALALDVTFPDINVTIPLTTDGRNAPNFTKLMLISFEAVPKTVGAFSTVPCTGVSCRVEFNFVPFSQWGGNPPRLAVWNDFEKAYVPQPQDIASSSFNCDQYRTLFVNATHTSGSWAAEARMFFINCDTKITVVPVERRFVLGSQPGNSFNLTAWNPKEGADRTFNIEMTTTNPSSYPLPWIRFDCEGLLQCQAGPVDGDPWLTSDDRARLTAPALTSRTVFVDIDSAARSGSYPVTFVATDAGVSYSTLATILIFAEALDEFAAWQLAGLVAAALVVVAYMQFGMKHKKKSTRRKTRKRHRR